jgi:F-type H+-transporting ATPase subunit delta
MRLNQALADSREFHQLIASPLVDRDEAGKVFAAVAEQLNLDPITANFLGVLARNGRKSQLARSSGVPQARRRAPRRDHRRRRFAHPLSDDQVTKLKAQLKARVGIATSRSTPAPTRRFSED